ncbi:RNA-binding domain-containing protein [Catenibacterium sp.]|uniref:RNA-binding domain-containing protein n=1 Tax=Catenibacterium sp. TaxID=2049022 RepID=UPI003FD80A1A
MNEYHEDERTELKRELINDIKCEIVAFLNSDGGTIYVGVDDDGKVIGFDDYKIKDEMDLKIGNWMQDSFYPKPFGLIQYAFNKDNVLVISVCKGTRKPYFLKDKGPKPSGVFIRVGRSKRKATNEEILHMIMESHNYSYEDDISNEQELTFKEFERTLDENGIKPTSRLMNSLGLKNKHGFYTNLGYIMSDQSNIVVKLAEYDDNMNFKIKKSFGGSLVTILKNVEEQAERLNDLKIIIDGNTFKRIETKSYPGASIREMIMNAICHADYFIHSNIKIEFFPDKVKITSPGGIFNASLEDIMNGVQTYRNPKLVHIFDKLGMIENFGTGIPRTIYSYEDYDIQPEFKITNNFFVVTLPNINFYNELESSQVNTKNSADGRLNDRINAQNKTDGRLNDRINAQNKTDGRLNDRINAQNKVDGRLNGRINAQNDADGRLNGRINTQNDVDGRLNGRINTQNMTDGRLNDRINVQNDADGLLNARENEQNNMDDQFNESISELGKEILMIIMQNPGIRIPKIVIKLSDLGQTASYSQTRNCIRRNLLDYVERRGSKKSGGYYLKDKF